MKEAVYFSYLKVKINLCFILDNKENYSFKQSPIPDCSSVNGFFVF